MATSDTQAPYNTTARVWRDEQPGDEPRLIVSITCAPRTASDRWTDVQVRTIEVRAQGERWVPNESAVSASDDGGFEVKASGPATLPAGASATIVVTLQTSSGEKRLELTADIERVG
jgi:hypothetical protein